jgi:protein-tyrosine-phosphatase/DNA-binding transcriptional ArsR family regulator
MNIQPTRQSPQILKLLANDLRWQLVCCLARSDLKVQELVARVDRPQNLVSYHLKHLRDSGLVVERRSEADGRDIYYNLDLERLLSALAESGQELHPALALPNQSPVSAKRGRMASILFLCTHNSARSQMAEAIINATLGSPAKAYSAGIAPTRVHPAALAALAELDIIADLQRSKSIDELAGITFDLVVTVCDSAREVCPAYRDARAQIHWSIPDPAATRGSAEEIRAVFAQAAREIQRRVRVLLAEINFVVANAPSLPGA